MADDFLTRIRTAIDTGALLTFEYTLAATDVSVLHGRTVRTAPQRFLGRVVPLTAYPSDTPAVVWLATDITERANLAEKLEAAYREAERQRRIAEEANRAKSQFLAKMSHELRTPLNAILGFSEVLQQQMFGPIGRARYLEYAQHIHDSGRYLLDLINDILDFARLEAQRWVLEETVVDIDAVVREGLQTVRDWAARRLVALVAPPAAVPSLWADRRALRQMLANLLSNAVKFTPAGGQVAVTCTRRPDGGLSITVADTGVGMDSATLAAALQSFTCAHRPGLSGEAGTGLGLSIVKGLMELHQGSLNVISRPGEGTTAILDFPPELTAASSGEIRVDQQQRSA